MNLQSAFNAAIDFSDPDFVANPYRTYAQLRQLGTVWVESVGGWVVTTHHTVSEILQSRCFVPAPRATTIDSSLSLQSASGHDHTRLKTPVAGAFHPKSVRLMEGSISEWLRTLLSQLPRGETIDLMAEVAHPMAAHVIAGMLGVHQCEVSRLSDLAMQVAMGMGPARDAATRAAAEAATNTVIDHFAELIAERKEHARDDMISYLAGCDELTAGESARLIRLLLFTGTTPMAFAIGNGLAALLNHPSQVERLRLHPELLPAAVEECLRFDPVVQFEVRTASTDVSLDEHSIQAEDRLMLMLGSANRDELVYSNPNVLDITRQPNPHISFSRGQHTCLGLHLARVEMAIAIRQIVMGSDNVRLAGEAEPHLWPVLRGLKRLPVVIQ